MPSGCVSLLFYLFLLFIYTSLYGPSHWPSRPDLGYFYLFIYYFPRRLLGDSLPVLCDWLRETVIILQSGWTAPPPPLLPSTPWGASWYCVHISRTLTDRLNPTGVMNKYAPLIIVAPGNQAIFTSRLKWLQLWLCKTVCRCLHNEKSNILNIPCMVMQYCVEDNPWRVYDEGLKHLKQFRYMFFFCFLLKIIIYLYPGKRVEIKTSTRKTLV